MSDAVVLSLPGVASAETTPASLTEGLTPRQKAAILVLELGKEAAAPVLAELSEAELEQLSKEVARLGDVDRDLAAAVMEEFALAVTTEESNVRGGLDVARSLLQASLSADRAVEIAER